MQPIGRTLSILFLFVSSAALAGCFGDADEKRGMEADEEAPRLATADWKAGLSTPRFEGIVSTLHEVKARDGTRLSLTLHLPADASGEALPTLLEITPYQSFIMPSVSTPATGTSGPGASWAFFVERGAAYVQADARGTNGSEGCLDFGGTKDREDARVFIDWIRDQEWSNGVVVTDGVSHPGMGSVVAHAASSDLTAALSHAPVVSYYQDEWLQGARFEDQANGAAYQAVELSPPAYADPGSLAAQGADCTGETLLDFNGLDGRFTPLWDDRHLARHHEAALEAETPILLTHGFIDLNVHPDHTQLYWDALPEGHPKWLIMGWWYHGWPDMEGHPAEEFEAIRHRWLDATLFGADNGLFAEPHLLVEDSKGTWHESPTWPLAPSESVVLRPTQNGAMFIDQLEHPVSGEVSYHDAATAERGRWTESHVAFRTEPLTEARLVNGAPTVKLVATSDTEETKWVVYLLDEAPDGTWQRISHGYVDSHQWDGESNWEPMVPGERYTWNVSLMPTAVVVEEGHRVVLLVTSQDSRIRNDATEGAYCFDDHRGGCYRPSGIQPAATAGRATNAVFVGGEDGTKVHLHWVDPASTAKPPGS